jgi:predicted nucleotidyltransferase
MISISDKQHEIAAACRANDVKRLELFGSRARNEATAMSDVDLLVEFNDPRRAGVFDRFLTLRERLEEILNCRVDLVETSSVQNPILRRRIEQDKRTIYAA